MAKKRAKRKQKQIVVTKEKLQKNQEIKQEETKVKAIKPKKVKQEVKSIIVNNEPLKDMLGNNLEENDDVVYVSKSKNGRMITKAGKVLKCTNKSITVFTAENETIKVRNVIKINVRQVVKQEVKKLSVLEYIKGMFIKK